jgi:hypothetical protein
MPLVSTQKNDDGVTRRAWGSRTGTRTAANFTVSPGFVPKYVKVVNLTDRIQAEWFGGFASGLNQTNEILTVAAGTRTYATAGIAVDSTSGDITVTVATAGLETDDDDVVWYAEG